MPDEVCFWKEKTLLFVALATYIHDRTLYDTRVKQLRKRKIKGHTVMTGFGHGTVPGVADQVVEAVKNGAIRHFFLVAGCNGARLGRNYYTEFVKQVLAVLNYLVENYGIAPITTPEKDLEELLK